MKKAIKYLTVIFLLGMVASMFSACAEKKQNSYQLTTNFELWSGEEKVSTLKTDGDAQLRLRLTYSSDIPFVLEVALFDNYRQRAFEMKQGTAFIPDDRFVLKLEASGGAMLTVDYQVRVKGMGAQPHDLLLSIQNQTALKNGSLRAHHFLRLAVNPEKADAIHTKLPQQMKTPFTALDRVDTVMEIAPSVTEKQKKLSCDLFFDVSKVYAGERFQGAYEDNRAKQFPFVVLLLQENTAVMLDGESPFLWSETEIGCNGKVSFEIPSRLFSRKPMTFVLIPYPFLNPDEADRYKLILYHSACYSQYDFNESIIKN